MTVTSASKNHSGKVERIGGATALLAMLAACGGGGGAGSSGNTSNGGQGAPSYTVGGSASGVVGNLVLQDNGGDALTLDAAGAFTFATALPAGAGYAVTVATQPAGQTCTVSN